MTRFLALDGEGMTVAGNRQAYVLMCASDGSSIQSRTKDGLGTLKLFDWLLDLKALHHDAIFVGFGFNYDVNMILKDLPRDVLEEIWADGETVITHGERTFKLAWIPSKFFSIQEDRTLVKIFDVWGFFQSSFLNALDRWEIGTENERDLIGGRKGERGAFERIDWKEVKRYCFLECDFLVRLMDKLTVALEAADLKPSAWYGPGAIAGKLLNKTVKEYHAHDDNYPPKVRDAIMRAYFGGRVEIFMQGELRNVTSYDIRSAYPRAMLELPALKGGHWRKVNRGDYDPRARLALWAVRWKLDNSKRVTPFPVRCKRSIYYPLRGVGWYHAPEVRIATHVFGDAIEVMEGYVFEPATDERPFQFVHDVYEKRKLAKAAGKPEEYAYKLALNSLYGKLAQGMGFQGRTPAFQSYVWAGAVTSWTRARVLDMISVDPMRAVSVATDGVIFLGDPNLPESKELGGFERDEWDEFFVCQSGVYYAVGEGGKEIMKSRGFFARDLDFDAIREIWMEDGVWGEFEHTSRRFYGIGSALGRTDFDVWRRWADEPRRLTFFAHRKFYARDVMSGYTPRAVERLTPPGDTECKVSEVYVPKRGQLDFGHEDWEYIAGIEQPRILE